MRKLRYFFKGRLFPAALLLVLFTAAFFVTAYFLPRLLAPLALFERALALAAGCLVAAEDSLPERRTARLLLLLLLPWTGIVICLFTRPRRTGNAPEAPLLPVRTAEYLPDGRAFREHMLADLKRAKERIFLDYYIIARGVFWNGVLNVLKERAEHGVTVKIIYDDFGCALTLPRRYQKTLERFGIACRVFRPVFFPSLKKTKRDHRKLLVIDGEIAYTGGINLADEYVGEVIRFGHWKDTAVRVTGGIAREAERCFLAQWENQPQKRLPLPPVAGMVGSFVADGIDGSRQGARTLLQLFRTAQERLYLYTPYLMPDSELLSALFSAAAAGVDVRILIPHIPDKRWIYLLSRRYAGRLIGQGIKVREYTAGFLHAKCVLADQTAFVSSYNLDFRSVRTQAECGILLKDNDFSERVAADFFSVWNTSAPPAETTKTERLISPVLNLFSPLL